MAAIVDDIYYRCKTKYVEKCVKHGIKIIGNYLIVEVGIKKLLGEMMRIAH